MLLRTVEYLDQALEYDRLAREATKPSDKTKYANRAEFYRWFAGEREKIPDADPDARGLTVDKPALGSAP